MLLKYYYFELLFYIFFICCLLTLLIVISFFLSKDSFLFEINKNSIYECGFDTFNSTKNPFEIHFYIIGIIFIIFDVEIAFLFPWIINFYFLTFYGFWAMYIFLFVLIIGFYYELKNNILNW